jgi:hypothetical protein
MGSEQVPITSSGAIYQLYVRPNTLYDVQCFGTNAVTHLNFKGFLAIHVVIGLVQVQKNLVPRLLIQKSELLHQLHFNCRCTCPLHVDAAVE